VLFSLVGNVLTKIPRQVRRAVGHLKPIIEERYRMMAEYGNNWQNKPTDLLQWLMDTAEGEEKTVKLLSQRILTVNFAAIHTTSQVRESTYIFWSSI
jgi:hypothetical protein